MERNPFDEFSVSGREDGCRRETGYSAELLLTLFQIYAVDIFVNYRSPPTCFLDDGVATQQQYHFYLMYKYIHVRGRTNDR